MRRFEFECGSFHFYVLLSLYAFRYISEIKS
jgi:hypothetical protein